MLPKYLEVQTGPGEPAMKFQLVEVEENTFMLPTRESVIDLIETCSKWVDKNSMMRESGYQKMIQLRAGLIHDLGESMSSLAIDSVNFTNESLMGANKLDDSTWTNDIQELKVAQNRDVEEVMLEEKVGCSDNLFIGTHET